MRKRGEIVTATKLEVAPNLRSLFRYLIDNDSSRRSPIFNPEYLRIYPPDALAKLQSGDPGWERMVPPEVVEIIKEREFFGYRAPKAALSDAVRASRIPAPARAAECPCQKNAGCRHGSRYRD